MIGTQIKIVTIQNSRRTSDSSSFRRYSSLFLSFLSLSLSFLSLSLFPFLSLSLSLSNYQMNVKKIKVLFQPKSCRYRKCWPKNCNQNCLKFSRNLQKTDQNHFFCLRFEPNNGENTKVSFPMKGVMIDVSIFKQTNFVSE